MIRLRFSIAGPRSTTVDPAPAFRFEAHGVVAEPAGVPVAQFSGQMWQVGGRYFTHCACSDSTLVLFELSDGKLTGPLGPFGRVDLYGGSLYAEGTLLARFDSGTQTWHAVGATAQYRALLLRSA